MSEHQRHTAFLKRLVSFGDTPDCRELLERIQNAERDERSVRRKISGLILLVLLSIIGFGYVKLFAPDHFFYAWPVLVRVFSVLSLGAVIGLVFFTGFWRDGEEREVTFVYSSCGCPVKVMAKRTGEKTVRTKELPVIYPDDPAALALINQLMGW